MGNGNLMKLFGAIIFLAGALFASLFGIIEYQTQGSLYYTNFNVFLGIELAITLLLFIVGILLFIFGMIADNPKKMEVPSAI